MKRDRNERRSVGSVLFAVLAAVILAVGAVVVSPGCTLMARAEGRPVSIDSCTISGGDVVCQVSTGRVPATDDGNYYVYADEVWQDGTTGQVVAAVPAGT